MSTIQPHLFLITGIMAAGKSTVAQRLAERLPKSVHLRGDLFRRMIVNGQVEIGLELSPEAYGQLKLRYQVMVDETVGYILANLDQARVST